MGPDGAMAVDETALLQARLDGLATRIVAETRVPGIAIGASVRGRRVHACAGARDTDGRAPLCNADTFRLGCAAKLAQALTSLDLARRGILDLDAPIGEYLPALRATPHATAVRVAHLLSHTSGYRGTNVLDPKMRALTPDGLVDFMRGTPRLFTAGSVFSYEHTESVLLEQVLERVAESTRARAPDASRGRDDADAGRHRFDDASGRFVALEAADDVPPLWQAAFSTRRVTIDDLLELAELALDVPELQRSVIRLPPTAGGPLRELLPVAFGLGAAELADGSRGNTGVSAGQCLGLRFAAESRVCVAVALNALVPHLRDVVLAALWRELGDPACRRPTQRFDFSFEELTGTYIGPGAAVADIRLVGERMVCALGRENRPEKLYVELVLDDDGRAVVRSTLPQLSIGFLRAPQDDAVGLMLGLSAYKRISR
jgi:hypothetical protein